MQYAQVVLGLPVIGPFDYSVPEQMRQSIRPGSRVEVFLRRRRMTAYVVGLSAKTEITGVRNIIRLIDSEPLLDSVFLKLTRVLAQRSCCSWGEMIETALPEKIRTGVKVTPGLPAGSAEAAEGDVQPLLVHDLAPEKRWEMYVDKIRAITARGRRVLVLVPDERALEAAKSVLRAALSEEPAVLLRKSPDETDLWLKIRSGEAKVVLGMRSAIFAPVPSLGLIIVDQEQDEAYKQDQVPHYHARDAALLRGKLEKVPVVFGSTSPSAEMYMPAAGKKIAYQIIERSRPYPEITILDLRAEYYRFTKKNILSKLLEDIVAKSIAAGGKVLLFLNRTGFATWAACNNCGEVVKCPRCAGSLVFHYSLKKLRCHHCPFSMDPPNICPSCQAGYIKYSGLGTEKVESEIARVFPQARIGIIDDEHPAPPEGTNIFIASRSGIRRHDLRFDLVAVLGIDNALNRIDFRAAEKVNALFAGLLLLTDKKIVIQTRLAQHPCFLALQKKDPAVFYEADLKSRQELGFPPYRHLLQVKLRGKDEEKVQKLAGTLFEKFKAGLESTMDIVSAAPGHPAKLRGNFYWQVLLTAADTETASTFIKAQLKGFRHSGIIITVNVDPV